MTTPMSLQPWSQQMSSLSNTTVVAISTNVCLRRRSLCSNLAGIDREKLYRAIFICQYGLCCCICPNFCSTVLGNLQKFFGQMVYRPPWQKIARTPMLLEIRRHGSWNTFPRRRSRIFSSSSFFSATFVYICSENAVHIGGFYFSQAASVPAACYSS